MQTASCAVDISFWQLTVAAVVCVVFSCVQLWFVQLAPALQNYKLVPVSDKARPVRGQTAALEPPISSPCSTAGLLWHYLSFRGDRSPSIKWGDKILLVPYHQF